MNFYMSSARLNCVYLCVFTAGFIDFLVSQHPTAQVLRDHVIFKIVPMLNPDGVYLGNYRSAETNECTHNIIYG